MNSAGNSMVKVRLREIRYGAQSKGQRRTDKMSERLLSYVMSNQGNGLLAIGASEVPPASEDAPHLCSQIEFDPIAFQDMLDTIHKNRNGSAQHFHALLMNYKEQEPEYLFKDLSGRGITSTLSAAHLRRTWEMDAEGDNGMTLEQFLNAGEVGDEITIDQDHLTRIR